MKERPILFSAPMVKALLEGRKTMTRRSLRDQGAVSDVCGGGIEPPIWWPMVGQNAQSCRYGEPGDRLWVKETWWHHGQWRLNWNGNPNDWHWDGWQPKNESAHLDDLRRFDRPDAGIISTKDNREAGAMVWRLRPSIYLPRWASRVTLEVTDVRVERLQDITEQDARAEGAIGLQMDRDPETGRMTNLAVFEGLWDSLNAKRGPWASNPWVWVVSFKRVCQCQSEIEQPGPHLATCPWADPNHDGGGFP